MKINQLTTTKNYLYEGLDSQSLRSIKLWESAGRKLVEYEMTADQISQLFAQVQKGATDAGGNRTMIGKGKDVATAVNTAWTDLKTKVQDSGPIQAIDAKYDQAAAKLKQATGGDAGVMKYVEKYRAFAKAHPVAQSLIYAALIAAAGVSGAGAGGAAALGLFKLTDKLLQGEKFSSAAYAGAKTGAIAYGASKLSDLVKSGFNTSTQTGKLEWNGGTTQATLVNGKIDGTVVLNSQTINPGDPNYAGAVKTIMKQAADDRMLGTGAEFSAHAGKQIKNMATKSDFGSFKENKSSKQAKLTETQIKRMFHTAARIQQLNEGILDKIKGAAGAVVNKAQTVGTNLTTKVTADKLMSAWKKAGSPTDSAAVAKIMKQAGVDDAVITSTMKAPGNQSAAAAPDTTSAPVDAQTQQFIQQLVASYAALTEPEKAQLKKELEDAVTASDVGANVVKGTMESRRRNKRSV